MAPAITSGLPTSAKETERTSSLGALCKESPSWKSFCPVFRQGHKPITHGLERPLSPWGGRGSGRARGVLRTRTPALRSPGSGPGCLGPLTLGEPRPCGRIPCRPASTGEGRGPHFLSRSPVIFGGGLHVPLVYSSLRRRIRHRVGSGSGRRERGCCVWKRFAGSFGCAHVAAHDTQVTAFCSLVLFCSHDGAGGVSEDRCVGGFSPSFRSGRLGIFLCSAGKRVTLCTPHPLGLSRNSVSVAPGNVCSVRRRRTPRRLP